MAGERTLFSELVKWLKTSGFIDGIEDTLSGEPEFIQISANFGWDEDDKSLYVKKVSIEIEGDG